MALNNYSQLYKKLSYYICICFCLFFVIVANLMRFNQLQATRVEPQQEPRVKSSQVYSVFFQTKKNPSKMIFIQDNINPIYLSSVFSQINEEKYQTFFILNCSKQRYENGLLRFLASKYKNIDVLSKDCQMSQDQLKTMLEDGQSLIVFILNEKKFTHKTALKAAEKLTLKPSIKISEIKNASR